MVTMNKGNKRYINFKLVIHSAKTGFKTGGAKVQVTGHMSQVIVLPIQKVS